MAYSTISEFYTFLQQNQEGTAHDFQLKYVHKGKLKVIAKQDFVQQVNSYLWNFIHVLRVKKGDFIVSLLANNPNWMIVEWAILLCGGVHIPLRIEDGVQALNDKLKRLEFSMVITDNDIIEKKMEQELDSNSVRLINIKKLDFVRSKDLIHHSALPEVGKDDRAVVLFTSGSSSSAKGIIQTHENMLTAFQEFAQLDFMQESHVYLNLLHHSFSGGRKVCYAFLLNGKTICFQSRSKNHFENIELQRPDIIAVVPSMLITLYPFLINLPTTSLQTIICGGSRLSSELFTQYKELGIKVYSVYGLTETASIGAYNTSKSNKMAAVGKISRNLQYRISSEGELLLKGPAVSKCCIADKQVVSILDSEGFLHTGDLVDVDEDGFLFVRGRKSRVVKNSKGEFVDLEEIAEYLGAALGNHLCFVLEVDNSYKLAIGIHEPSQIDGILNQKQLMEKLRDEPLEGLVFFQAPKEMSVKIGVEKIYQAKLKEIEW